MQTFFDVASPTTLASLIADIENVPASESERLKYFALHRDASQALIAIVGNDEARVMIDAAGGVAVSA